MSGTNDHDHPMQAVVIDHECTNVVFAAPTETFPEGRVFYDMTSLGFSIMEKVERDSAECDPEDPIMAAFFAGQAAIVLNLAGSAMTLLDMFAIQEAVAGITTLADFGFSGLDGDLS